LRSPSFKILAGLLLSINISQLPGISPSPHREEAVSDVYIRPPPLPNLKASLVRAPPPPRVPFLRVCKQGRVSKPFRDCPSSFVRTIRPVCFLVPLSWSAPSFFTRDPWVPSAHEHYATWVPEPVIFFLYDGRPFGLVRSAPFSFPPFQSLLATIKVPRQCPYSQSRVPGMIDGVGLPTNSLNPPKFFPLVPKFTRPLQKFFSYAYQHLQLSERHGLDFFSLSSCLFCFFFVLFLPFSSPLFQ